MLSATPHRCCDLVAAGERPMARPEGVEVSSETSETSHAALTSLSGLRLSGLRSEVEGEEGRGQTPRPVASEVSRGYAAWGRRGPRHAPSKRP